MEWYIILILVLGIPVILLPVAFVWYLDVSGLYGVMRYAVRRRRARAARTKA